jgi:serine phosphatase RsbU (regulator of sigma subunit)
MSLPADVKADRDDNANDLPRSTPAVLGMTMQLPGLQEIPPEVFDPVRLAAVRATGLLDTAPEDSFDELTRLAATIAKVPLAFITVVDDTRSYWKSAIGMDIADLSRRQNPVLNSFCKYLIGTGGPVVIDDIAADVRVRDNPAVKELDIGAWAGYPIYGRSGKIVGGFFVISHEPRKWSEWELQTLSTLSRAASKEIALREALVVSEQRLTDMTEAHQTAVDLARALQDSLLPPALPGVPGVQIAASYQAAGTVEVVGDFYDLFHVVGNWWCAVIGDVCGHGLEAAKVTALARYTLRADANLHEQPSIVLANLDRALLAQNGVGGRYLTAAYVTFRVTDDGIDGRLCLAGHPKPVVRRADGAVTPIGVSGSLLGAISNLTLTDVDFHLGPGDLLLLYTDGLTERRGYDDAQFGDIEFQRCVAATQHLNAYDTISRVVDAADAYSLGRVSDDTALLAIQVNHDPAGA